MFRCYSYTFIRERINPLNSELNPICHLLALLGAHHILHVSRIRVKGHYNPLKAELNPICHLLALLGAHHILQVSRIRVKEKKQDRKCTYNTEARSCSHCCGGKAISITCSECVSVACPAIPYFFSPTLCHKRHDFRKKKSLNTKRVF